MKIAIATDWFAPRRGGIEAQLLELAERLGARGHDVHVLTSTRGAADGEGYRVRVIDVARLPFAQVSVSPALLPALARELRSNYDVVHAHVSVVSPLGYAAAAVARSLSLPTVVTFHSVLRAKRLLLRAANALAGIGGSRVVWSAVSEAVAAQARDALGSDVAVLPNAVDLSYWRGAGDARHASGDGVVLVSTMRLHRKKRPVQLVRSFLAAAGRTGVAARLLVVGDGPERRGLEREAARAGGRVELFGWRSRDEIRSLYARADGFVLASEREAFGIAALEATAAGLPVVAMSASGSREFLQHDGNALLCADDADLARQLGRFLVDGALRSRLAPDGERLSRYDWSVALAEHDAIYGRAIARAAAARTAAATA